jgi:hypothetical protein
LHAGNGKTPVGTFFAFGGLVAGLPQSTTANPNDEFYVVWHFRINGGGAFDTTGPVRSTTTYSQTITGSTNTDLVPNHGAAKITNLATGTGLHRTSPTRRLQDHHALRGRMIARSGWFRAARQNNGALVDSRPVLDIDCGRHHAWLMRSAHGRMATRGAFTNSKS